LIIADANDQWRWRGFSSRISLPVEVDERIVDHALEIRYRSLVIVSITVRE
jgi:hypothetical protein